MCASLWGQVTSSDITGSLRDPGGAVVPGVQIKATDQATGTLRTVMTGDAGLFHFSNLQPGTYNVSVDANGFKGYTQKGIILSSSETRDLGSITLEIGSVTESIEVTAQATPVQTASSEKSALVDAKQIETVALKGRDMFGMLQLIPGITGATGGDTTGTGLPGAINGGGNKNFTVDGVTDMDTGSNGSVMFEPNLDTIAEIKVLTSNYAAEYGRNANGTISVITKGGGQQFHGSGWWDKRHEEFNANTFFNNKNTVTVNGIPGQATAKPLYRYDVSGWSFGGPLYIPKLFNTKKQKLFFFGSQEYTKQKPNTSIGFAKMPTAAERSGDFSQTTDSNGKLLAITDPQNNNAAFAGNKIPSSRIDPTGLAMLNFFPLPNYTETSDPANLYTRNYKLSTTPTHPRRNDDARVDWNITSKLNSFVRWNHDFDASDSIESNFQVQGKPIIFNHPNGGHGYAVSATYTLSPTLVNEATFGKAWNTWTFIAGDPTQLQRSNMGNPPHWYDSAALPADPNYYANWLPTVSFAGGLQTGAPSFGQGNVNDAEPRYNANDIYSFGDNLSKTKGKHNLKFGIYYERTEKQQGKGNFYTGNYAFGSSANSPLDTKDGFANALLGYVQSYQEGTKTIYDTWFSNTEIYAQDNWRVTRKLTLDLGVRMYINPPYIDHNGTFSSFSPANFNPAQAPRIYTYGKDATGNLIAVDPANPSNVKPKTYFGLYVVDASGAVIGNPADGWTAAGVNTTYTTNQFLPAPRIGLAYDPFGDGKTAIRTGFGLFFNRFDVNQVYQMSGLPPVTYLPQVSYVTIPQLAVSAKLLSPPSSSTFMQGPKATESTMNGSFGIQRNVGFGTVVDVSWVGAFRRHTLWNYDMNHIGTFAQYAPQNANPSNLATALPNQFFQPIQGMGTLNSSEMAGSSNYNSLQVSVNKRFSRGLSYGLAYTFEKTILISSPSYVFPTAERNRASATTPPHLLVMNYSYELPGLGRKLGNKFVGAILDKWTLSGITTVSSGSFGSVGFSYSSTVPISQTGSADGARINVLCNPNIDSGQKTFYHQFDTSCFSAPPPCSFSNESLSCFGNGGTNYLLGPGWTNFDMTMAKRIPLGKNERRSLNLRAEAFNVFNHSEFNGMNTSEQFNLATGALITTGSSATLGQITSARNPRQMAFEVRLQF